MSNHIKELFSRDEIRLLTQKSDLQAGWAIVQTWGLIGLCFALLINYPHPVMWVVVVMLLGGQQLACAIITHEASHRTLFKTKWLNTHLADWLCARPVWLDVERYRQHHLQHHLHTGTKDDPDMSLVSPYPGTASSLRRKIARDLLGYTGLKRILGLLLMDIGAMKYTMSGDVTWLDKSALSIGQQARSLARNAGPVVIANLLLFAMLQSFGAGWAYLAWPLAYLSSFSLYIRIRSLAEHACMPGGSDIFDNTRTTAAGYLAKLTVAPHHVNYHQEHHLMASVPFYNLPRMHRLLIQRRQKVTPISYWQVLKLASSSA